MARQAHWRGNADFAGIQEAVDAAQPGWMIRVCPGLYPESIVVGKPLTIRGQPSAVEALDCFDPAPSALGDLDPTQQAIVDGSTLPGQELFDLGADNIELGGFVLQGAASATLPADTHLYRRAINTTDAHSGYRIHHNLLRLNTVGIQFGSLGASTSRVDHNCIRDNLWGLATDDRALVNADVDHNATYRTRNNAFEPALGRLDDVTFQHNTSRQDNTAYLIRNSTGTRINQNVIESARLGIVVGGGRANVGLELDGNTITNPFGGVVLQGIAFAPPSAGEAPNTMLAVTNNSIVGLGNPANGIGDGMVIATESVTASLFAGNVVSDNLRDGIALRPTTRNTGNVLRDNTAERNGRYGIYSQGALGNLFETNWMLENGRLVAGGLDARDDARAANTWSGNHCVTDFPAGTICGVG